MNKHKVMLDMMKDEILFVPGRYSHQGDKVSAEKDLTFVPSSDSTPVPLKSPSPPAPTVEDDLDSKSDSSTPSSPRRRTVPTPRAAKECRLKDPDYLDIHEISADAFYLIAKNTKNKLFSLTLTRWGLN